MLKVSQQWFWLAERVVFACIVHCIINASETFIILDCFCIDGPKCPSSLKWEIKIMNNTLHLLSVHFTVLFLWCYIIKIVLNVYLINSANDVIKYHIPHLFFRDFFLPNLSLFLCYDVNRTHKPNAVTSLSILLGHYRQLDRKMYVIKN